ncbi:MAG: PPOX class F420-dependent oxidoreductase [Chloroflexota bacterium]
MNHSQAIEFLADHRQAVLSTIRRGGRPQLSNVLAVYEGGRILVSITETRSKYHNLVRDPRASLLFLGDSFWEYLVVDGDARIIRLPDAMPILRKQYEIAAGGPHPDWAEYEEAMTREKRVIASISVDHMYPLSG